MKFRNKRPFIAVILGTRPEVIKLSVLIRQLRKHRASYFLLHAGQHYSYPMDRLFFKELELPDPKYRLSVHQSPATGHGHHVGRMLPLIETILLKECPRAVLVQGDTNTVLAGALAASKIPEIDLGHVEAGLRSRDRSMPEEINRILTDHVSDYLFAPTKGSQRTLEQEGLDPGKIFVTGNTIVDAVRENLALARKKLGALPFGVSRKRGFFLLTLHRQENVDDRGRLASILQGLEEVSRKLRMPILFPAHPRTVKMLKTFHISPPADVRVLPPFGFLDFLRLEADARLILTDSGGVQEEACILRVPCVTLRTSTERPETVAAGANVIAGYRPGDILRCARDMMERDRRWENPFGDGRASQRILRILERRLS
ncbi:MAG: UDP-N-acetylglucosamine 2-epimerase (non-hydrolyzing) [Candidatus Omnitrophica bacterium]|nr:UDP-N-acetylglucosamine 2-epimerase (non-hydrolyzing) [Candidatus Omnitrophota bacterium]